MSCKNPAMPGQRSVQSTSMFTENTPISSNETTGLIETLYRQK